MCIIIYYLICSIESPLHFNYTKVIMIISYDKNFMTNILNNTIYDKYFMLNAL